MRFNPDSFGQPPKRKFHYSAYWGTWSRVLMVGYRGYCIAELNLTPINNEGWDEDVKREIIRVHATAHGDKDVLAHELPPAVLRQMEEHLGKALTERLLDFDYVVNVDWARAQAQQNGGVPYANCKRSWAEQDPEQQLLYFTTRGHALQGLALRALTAAKHMDPAKITAACAMLDELSAGLSKLLINEERPEIVKDLQKGINRLEDRDVYRT